jgi:regulation of enolase protein 1 (concanavalin A-like superfamily)/LmbE family N-acetylglucosaminyl deacetylase
MRRRGVVCGFADPERAAVRFLSVITLCVPLTLFAVFTVGGAGAATAEGSSSGASIRSDEFDATTLDTAVWRFVDPVGDATLTMNGSQAVISLPAGVSHDLWTGVNTAPRLLQDVPDQDFEVEVKLDSTMGSAFQLQGIVVEQDADDLLRLEIHHDGGATRLFAGVIAGGVASSAHYSTVESGTPAYLRVKREGNQWTLSHSRDGTSWTSAPPFTHAMTVASVGPFVGNSGGSAPAFEGKIDHFRVIAAMPVPPPDATPPVVTDVTPSPGAVAATVTWTTDEPATSEVAFGPSSAYENGSVSSSTPTLTHRKLLRGLRCGTVYHFQIRSSDEAGNEATTPDATFTTGACSASIRSDDFNSPSLNTGIWTLVDPLGDASVTMTGSQAEISLPAGVAHDVWVGIDTVARLLQPVPDADFEIEVKFDRPVTSAFQQQGLILEEDPNDLLRLEFHHDGGATRLFAASITAGSASVEHWSTVPGGSPKYLRLKRVGNQWTVRYSSDGASWTTAAIFTHAMTVNALGPFAGNGGSIPPSFTSAVDYFREVLPDTTPPAVTGVSASPGTISATVAWTTDELATSRVAYGATTAYEFGALSTAGTRTSHSLLLHGLRCGTTYHYQIRSVDLAGNAAAAPDGQLTTAPCPASLTSDEFDSSTIDPTRWLWVDPLGDASVSTSGTQAVISVPAGTRHDLWTGVDEVPRLLQATPDDDFEAEVKFDSPVTTRYQMQGLLVQQDPRNLLRVEVHQEGGSAYLFVAGLTDGTASVIHQRAVSGDAPVYLRLKRKGSKWTLRYSEDGETWISTSFNRALAVGAVGPFAGNSGGSPPAFAAEIDYFRYIPPDRTPPQISGLSATPGPIAAEIVWTTDEPATSTVAYGPTAAYEDGIAEVAGERRNHQVLLHGLRCGTTYHFQVRSADAEENVGASADGTFTTSACPTELTSDEFDASSLNTDLWTFFNPLNDATATADGSHVTISVPAGVAHDVWTTSDAVPRLLQAAPDSNFEVEAKFDSQVAVRYQQQGIIVEQDAQNLLRFEIHSEGTETKLFVAAITGDTASVKYNAAVPDGATSFLQVKRVNSTWTVRYSVDGETWPVSLRFDQPFVARAIGPFAGNAGNSPPAFSANVDYFRVVPPPPPDLTPPALTSIAALPHPTSATITWSTDELATSSVEWGPTSAYGQPWVAAGDLTAQRARLTGLACATTYHYRVHSTDAAGNEAASADRTFTTQPCASGPSIVVWRGSPQTFGTVGIPQRWINVLGNVEDPQGIGSLWYRLNSGPSRSLNIGPSDDRLAHAGDFNIELFYGDLRPGLNDVEITAVDTGGNSTVKHVQVDWQGTSDTPPPENGPVLVVVAHPDDEALGMTGVIHHAKAAGRRVYVAIVTNGDSGLSGTESGYCGAASGDPATNAAYGLTRLRETATAMGMLGLHWSASLMTTDIIYLGYPQLGIRPISESTGSAWEGDSSGLHRTYAEDFDGSNATCNGDFRYLLDGRHSQLKAGALAADFESLLDVTRPSDIYTHAEFDGNPDHAKLASSLMAAIVRKEVNVRVHSTLIHPEGTEGCQPQSAAVWPNPPLLNNDPFARFTPTEGFTQPPVPACDPDPTGSSWGPEGAPNELVEVPPTMQAPTEADNLKWQVISRYETQIDCTQNGGDYHVNCGYMRAFVKRHEFFWTMPHRPPRIWPMPYTAHWTSTGSISEQAQIFEGQWAYDGNGIRPVATGFDRVITLGDMHWTDYEVTAEMTFNSFDTSRPVVGSAVGLALGWQGHSDWGQPRFGHPSGGLCLYAYNAFDPLLYRLQIGYSPGPAHDTIMASQNDDLPLGVPFTMRFRERDLGNGSTRYSCKLWRSDKPEPSAWTLEADIPHWEGETGTHPGSIVLVAHHADATFGDVTVTPLD